MASLRVRLLILVMIGVLPCLGWMIYLINHTHRLNLKEIEETAGRLSAIHAKNFESQIEQSHQLLSTLSFLPEVRANDVEKSRALFLEVTKLYPYYANIGIVRPDGTFITNALDYDPKMRANDRLWFQRAMGTKKFAVGEYQIGRITKVPSVNFAQPILDGNGEVQSVIFVALRLDWFKNLYSLSKLPDGSVLLILDHTGKILYRTLDTEKWMGEQAPERMFVWEQLRDRPTGSVMTAGVDGIERLYGFKKIAANGNGFANPYYVLVGINKAAAMVGVQPFYWISLIGWAGSALLALILAWILGDLFIRRPLHRQLMVTRLFGQGFLNARSGPPYPSTEMGELAKTFDEMADSLKERQEQIADHKNRLEKALVDLKETQKKLMQQERILALGQMASGISHDFYNYLSTILGITEVILANPKLYEEDRQKLEEYIQLVNRTAQEAAAVVQRLKEFYRQRDEDEPFTPVDLNILIAETFKISQLKWKDLALAKGIDIEAALDMGKIPNIMGSEPELGEAITCLIFNAVEAMPDGGKLTLRSRADVNHVYLEVEDTGKGMDEETRQRCFEPFFTTKGDEKRSGLGLSVVFGIVQRHGGSIELRTAPNQGTRVTLVFPVISLEKLIKKPSSAKLPANQNKNKKPLSILVVENEKPVREILLDYLKTDGHSGIGVESTQRAADELSRNSFDLVITDGALPGKKGYEFAEWIKKQRAGMPVILLTGYADYLIALGENYKGVDKILPKPVTLQGLREAIDSVI